ncbi:unnamed protein product, partial [Closterium sp. NIES-53]
GPPAAEREPPGRRQEEHPSEQGRQWWRTPPLGKKQTQAQARRGPKQTAQRVREQRDRSEQQLPQQARTQPVEPQGPGALEQEQQTGQAEPQQEQTGQPPPPPGEPRVRGDESFQRLLTRASEPAVEEVSRQWSPFRAPTEAWRRQPTRRQRALATARQHQESPSQARGGRGTERQTASGVGGGPENGYQAAAR